MVATRRMTITLATALLILLVANLADARAYTGDADVRSDTAGSLGRPQDAAHRDPRAATAQHERGARPDAAPLALAVPPPRRLAGAHTERPTGKQAGWANPVNRNLLRIARCETGGINDGRPLWAHRARSEHPGLDYEGALGFLETTWDRFRWQVRPLPPDAAWKASPAEQLAVARVLVRTFGGYSSWPACSRRLGLR